MTHRPILTARKTGTISHVEARKAVKAVKVAKKKGNYAKRLPWSARKNGATTVGLEQYLGHFGVSVAKKTSGKKRSTTKKTSAKKAYRRAS